MYEIILTLVFFIAGTLLLFFPDKVTGKYIENPIWSEKDHEIIRRIGGLSFYVALLLI